MDHALSAAMHCTTMEGSWSVLCLNIIESQLMSPSESARLLSTCENRDFPIENENENENRENRGLFQIKKWSE